ncbi:MAG: phosphoribosylformylglycinamidine cyclo-ligase [Actinomycetota bacterium]
MEPSGAYRRAGVDLDAARDAVSLISDLARGATRPEVVGGIGGFAGLFRVGGRRLLAAATDGVGTKVEVARRVGRLDTVGIDLVAMCANDVVCTGAEPLFFLDYLATGRLDPGQVAQVVSGVAEGCRRAGCALLGGETAEHPGLIEEGRFDLAGFCVGSVEEESLLGPHRVREGDALVGLASTGLHANGFSLVRRLVQENGLDLRSTPGGLDRPLADVLLEPTAMYVSEVLEVARSGVVRAAAHVTGGGLMENVPRTLPPGLGAEIDRGSWDAPPVFTFLTSLADMEAEEAAWTFNLGLGMVLVAASEAAEAVVSTVRALGTEAAVVGRVTTGKGLALK